MDSIVSCIVLVAAQVVADLPFRCAGGGRFLWYAPFAVRSCVACRIFLEVTRGGWGCPQGGHRLYAFACMTVYACVHFVCLYKHERVSAYMWCMTAFEDLFCCGLVLSLSIPGPQSSVVWGSSGVGSKKSGVFGSAAVHWALSLKST